MPKQQQVNPDEWEKDVEDSERRLGNRRVAERRRRDRWGRRFERACLFLLVILYIVGFRSAENQNDKVEALSEQNTANIAQIKKLTGAIVEGNKRACEANNDVRNNQYIGLKEQIARTEVTLAKPNGLGALEPFRDQIADQNNEAIKRQNSLLLVNGQFKKPWLAKC